MISSLLKLVMKEFGLQQQGLAEVMGVSLDRVKSLTSNKVKNLKREEGEALIKKLKIRGDWLATGEGPMLQNDSEREFHRRLDAVKDSSAGAAAAGLTGDDAARLADILFHVESGNLEALKKALNPLASDEWVLVAAYRRCNTDARQNLIQTAALLAANMPALGTPTTAQTTKVKASVKRGLFGFASAKGGNSK